MREVSEKRERDSVCVWLVLYFVTVGFPMQLSHALTSVFTSGISYAFANRFVCLSVLFFASAPCAQQILLSKTMYVFVNLVS